MLLALAQKQFNMKPKYLVFNYKTVVVLLLTVLSTSVFIASCKKEKDLQSETLNADNAPANSEKVSAEALSTIAYEGYGSSAAGGANSSTVYHVTNLNSSGAGSLAAGIGSNKTIVFDLSGTIIGRFDLTNTTYLTIDATGQDITINNNNNGDGISFDGANTHHCILKGVHVTNAGNDGINVIDGAHDILITNCSSYGNRDGNIDIAADNSGQTKNVTVQWCILGKGGTGWAGDMLVTGQSVSVHHNLFSPSTAGEVGERCPLVHSNYSPVGNPNVDFRNNLVWKWGRSGGTGSGYGTAIAFKATGNVVNNYYYSVASPSSAAQPNDGYNANPGLAYINGNVSGNSGVSADSKSNHAIYSIPSTAAVTTQDACTAASLVLGNAGPRPLNAADQAIINGITLTGCSVGTGGGSGSTNQNPTVNAGADQTITLPVSTVTLTGTASDPDGTIASYVWTKVSGTGGTITSPAAASTTITGLTAGSYVFSLKVTDNQGATASDNVTVTVNAATQTGGTNQAPRASAGADQTITLPTNSVTFNGSGTDADGTIASYQWTKEVGPTVTITTPAAAQTTVTGMIAGSYRFRLTVTDNKGATGTDTVHVTVNGAARINQSPIVNAGAAQTITLPVSAVTLTGTASDPDGTIASYLWTKVSGTGGAITSPSTVATTVTGLTAGAYVFNLKVTDNNGATANSSVNVTVNAAPSGGGGSTAGYTMTYSNGYNSSSDISSNQLGRGGLSTSIYNAGPGSFRSEVRAGDAPISSGWRSEQQYDGSTYNPNEGAVEYDVYYENLNGSTWSGFDGGGHSVQWHPNTGGGSAIVSLQNYNGKFDVVRDPNGTVYHQSGTLMTCQANRWYHMRWEYKWSTGSDGYVRLYIDNQLYYSFTGATADGSGQYLKVGQNRWPYSGNTMTTTSVCYYDNLTIYKKG